MACELHKSHIISTDEDPGLRIESFAVINLRGVSTNKTIIYVILGMFYTSNFGCVECNSNNSLGPVYEFVCGSFRTD
jgi:hypothetical protein